MIANQILNYPVSQLDYQRGRASAIPLDEFDPGLYTARLLLSEVARPVAKSGIGVYAVEPLVKVERVSVEESHRFAVIRYVSEDGLPEGPVYTPSLTEDGFMQGTAAPLPTKEGYLLHSTGPLEDELREIEEKNSMPVRVVGTTAIPLERPLPYRLN